LKIKPTGLPGVTQEVVAKGQDKSKNETYDTANKKESQCKLFHIKQIFFYN